MSDSDEYLTDNEIESEPESDVSVSSKSNIKSPISYKTTGGGVKKPTTKDEKQSDESEESGDESEEVFSEYSDHEIEPQEDIDDADDADIEDIAEDDMDEIEAIAILEEKIDKDITQLPELRNKIAFIEIVPPDERVTSDIMTLYEVTEAIGLRAKQIEQGAPVLTNVEGITDPIEQAEAEMFAGKSPLVIERRLYGNKVEYWYISRDRMKISPHYNRFISTN